MLSGVIFGMQMSDEDKASIRQWAATGGHEIPYYQAERREDTFGLDINEID
jgi:hypothetical protein